MGFDISNNFYNFVLYNIYMELWRKLFTFTSSLDPELRKDFYFTNISAVYTTLTPEDIGMTKNSLLHAGLSGNGSVVTKKAIIKQSQLISTPRKK